MLALTILVVESARGLGLGRESLLLMMRYGVETLGLTSITAKIGYANAPSLKLFASLGFVEESRSDFFEEVTLRLSVPAGSEARAMIERVPMTMATLNEKFPAHAQ